MGRWLTAGAWLLLACGDVSDEAPPRRAPAVPADVQQVTLDVPLLCDDVGVNRGWREAICEQGGNKACAGQGEATSDCARCCEAPPPPRCAEVAQQRGWASFTCESTADLACGGLGEESSDCDVCCEATAQKPTSAQVAAEWGFAQVVCEKDGDGACGGEGIPTSDCDVCCDVEAAEDPDLADDPAPTPTSAPEWSIDDDLFYPTSTVSEPPPPPPGQYCGVLASSNGWANPVCEYNGNKACKGQGPETIDCDHCCAGSGSPVKPPSPCGDGVCSDGETCSSCSQDCGVCLRVAEVNLAGTSGKAELHRLARALKAQKPRLVGVQGATRSQARYLSKISKIELSRFAYAGDDGGQKVGHAVMSYHPVSGVEARRLPGKKLLLTADVDTPRGAFTFGTTQMSGGAKAAASGATHRLQDEYALLTAGLGAMSSSSAHQIIDAALPDGWDTAWGGGQTTEQREDFIFRGQKWSRPLAGKVVGSREGGQHGVVVQKYSPRQTGKMLTSLRAGHPRLLILPDDVARISQHITGGVAKQWHDELVMMADKLAAKGGDGAYVVPLMTKQPRPSIAWPLHDRIWLLGVLHRLHPERGEWSQRAIDEMLQVAAIPRWTTNPDAPSTEFDLDTADIMMSLGLGYDWFFDAMSAEQRKVVAAAIIGQGLKRGIEAYSDGLVWTSTPYNWSHVCNSGLIVGALAVMDVDQSTATDALTRAVDALKERSMPTFGPDGAWMEGMSYWHYATSYAVIGIEALRTALGKDFGLATVAGFKEGGLFRIHADGPTQLGFNFADAGEDTDYPQLGGEPALLWMGTRYKQPLYAHMGRVLAGQQTWAPRPQPIASQEIGASTGSPMNLLWYTPEGTPATLAAQPLDRRFRNVEVVTLRSAWNDPAALWVAFKGGQNGENHGDLDLGTFVLDAGGQRFAIDLGGDSYSLPKYFGKNRFNYYRKATRGQNTLTFTDDATKVESAESRRNQDEKAKAPIVKFSSRANSAFSIVDLSDAYSPQASKVQRGVAMLKGRDQVLIQDEMTAAQSGAWTWTMHTRASIAISSGGKLATLTQNGATLEARIISDEGSFDQEEFTLAPGELPTNGARRLTIHLKTKAEKKVLKVVFRAGSTADLGTRPLSQWASNGVQ